MLKKIESQLMELFVTKAPVQLPENSKKTLVQFMPWLALIGGIFVVLSAWSVYRWATIAAELSHYAETLNSGFGYTFMPSSNIGLLLWLAFVVLLVEGVMLFAAFQGLQARKKSGWNLVFYAALMSVVYSVTHFIAYEARYFSSFIMMLIGTTISMYLLFQIRSYYTNSLPKRQQTGNK